MNANANPCVVTSQASHYPRVAATIGEEFSVMHTVTASDSYEYNVTNRIFELR